MRDEFVRRRGWLDDVEFLDLVGASNLIPGPTSTELAMHVGHRRAGPAGLVVAGVAFILPAVVIVGILAWWYVEAGRRPEVEAVLAGVGPVVIAIIAHAGVAIGRTAVRTPLAAVLAVASTAGALAGISEILLLLGLGLISLGLREMAVRRPTNLAALPPLATIGPLAAVAGVAAPLLVFLEFLKIGAVLFGSGYVLVALLRDELVDRLGWITETQLLDAIAVGQATPGPLFSTATFIGYLVSGPAGAVAASAGIFLPAFVAVAVSIPVLARLRESARARAFLDGVNAAAVALLLVVAVQLALDVLIDPLAIALGIASLGALLRGVGTGPLIAAGAVVGLIRLWVPGA